MKNWHKSCIGLNDVRKSSSLIYLVDRQVNEALVDLVLLNDLDIEYISHSSSLINTIRDINKDAHILFSTSTMLLDSLRLILAHRKLNKETVGIVVLPFIVFKDSKIDFTEYEEIVIEIFNNNSVILVATGNEHKVDHHNYWPVEMNEVINVGSHDKDLYISEFNNFKEIISIYAPGRKVIVNEKEYSGNSLSVAIVAACLSLMVQIDSKKTIKKLYHNAKSDLQAKSTHLIFNNKRVHL